MFLHINKNVAHWNYVNLLSALIAILNMISTLMSISNSAVLLVCVDFLIFPLKS